MNKVKRNYSIDIARGIAFYSWFHGIVELVILV